MATHYGIVIVKGVGVVRYKDTKLGRWYIMGSTLIFSIIFIKTENIPFGMTGGLSLVGALLTIGPSDDAPPTEDAAEEAGAILGVSLLAVLLAWSLCLLRNAVTYLSVSSEYILCPSDLGYICCFLRKTKTHRIYSVSATA